MDRSKIIAYIFLFLSLVALLSSCSHKKAVVGLLPKEEVHSWQSMCNKNALPKSFSANFSLSLSGFESGLLADINNMQLSGQIRYLSDSLIWLSLGKFGIEAYRLWLTKDSVFVLDKFSRRCLNGGLGEILEVGFFEKFSKLGNSSLNKLNLNTLSALFLRAVPDVLHSANSVIELSDSLDFTHKLFLKDQNLQISYAFKNSSIKYIKIGGSNDSSSNLLLDYQEDRSWKLSYVNQNSNMEIVCKYSNIKIDESLSVNTNIAPAYKIVNVREL